MPEQRDVLLNTRVQDTAGSPGHYRFPVLFLRSQHCPRHMWNFSQLQLLCGSNHRCEPEPPRLLQLCYLLLCRRFQSGTEHFQALLQECQPHGNFQLKHTTVLFLSVPAAWLCPVSCTAQPSSPSSPVSKGSPRSCSPRTPRLRSCAFVRETGSTAETATQGLGLQVPALQPEFVFLHPSHTPIPAASLCTPSSPAAYPVTHVGLCTGICPAITPAPSTA